MSGWRTCVLEFGSLEARDDLLDWFEANHPVEFPEGSSVTDTYAPLTLDGFEYIADFALVGNYVYITCREDFEDAFHATATHWRRGTYAEFDAATETCQTATFYITEGEDVVTETEYEGVEGAGGVDILFRLTMEHQFRFRAYAAALPKTPTTFLPGAYDAVEPTDDRIGTLAALAGCETTDEGLSFLDDDFTQTKGFANQMGLDSNTLDISPTETDSEPEPEPEPEPNPDPVDSEESDEVESEPEPEEPKEPEDEDPSPAGDEDTHPDPSSDESEGDTDTEPVAPQPPEPTESGDVAGDDEADAEPEDGDETEEPDSDDARPAVDPEPAEDKTDGIAAFLSQSYEEGDDEEDTAAESDE